MSILVTLYLLPCRSIKYMNTCHACTIVDCSIIMRLEQFVRESRSEPAAYHKRKEVHPVLGLSSLSVQSRFRSFILSTAIPGCGITMAGSPILDLWTLLPSPHDINWSLALLVGTPFFTPWFIRYGHPPLSFYFSSFEASAEATR